MLQERSCKKFWDGRKEPLFIDVVMFFLIALQKGVFICPLYEQRISLSPFYADGLGCI